MKKRLLKFGCFLVLAVAWQVPVFAQYENYSTQPIPTFKTAIINGQLRFITVRGSYVFDPFTLFLTPAQANGLYKPVGYVPGWNEITGKPDFSQYLTSSYTGFDSRYKLANYNPSRAEILSGLGYTPYDGAVNPLGFLNNGSLNGYATQNYVNNQGFLTSAPVPSVFNRTGAIAANQTDYQAFYPLLSNAYNDPFWINTLAGTKITGLGNGAFLNASINSSPKLLVLRGSTGSITVNEIDASYLRALFPTETALLPNSILGIYSEPGMKSAARAFPLSTIAQSLQLGSMSKQDTSKFIKREYLQDMGSFKRTGQFYAAFNDVANPLGGSASTGIGVSVLSMFEGPDNGSYFIAADGYNTNTHRYYDAFGSLYANGAWHTSHFLLDNNFRDYVYSKGYIDTAFNNIALPFSRLTGTPTTLSGYGVTDAYTKTQSDAKYVQAVTTTGNSGPATLSGGILNVPNYGAATTYHFIAEVQVEAGQTTVLIPTSYANITSTSVAVVQGHNNVSGNGITSVYCLNDHTVIVGYAAGAVGGQVYTFNVVIYP